MKKKIYLFRHGQTVFNRDHKFTGWLDSKLTKQGVKDARIVAQKLKNKKFEVAFRSSTSRSKDTLKEILKFHPECKTIIVNDKMIERDYGSLSGMAHKELVKIKGTKIYNALVKQKVIPKLKDFDKKYVVEQFGQGYRQMMRRCYHNPPPKGESVEMVEKRVKEFIKYLIKFMKREKVNVAISAHGNSMRPFRKHFEKLSINDMMRLENPWDDYFEYEVEV
jgi:2,3-bisphosphoglycerate-dependent phosphoglycerate mutase